MTRRALLLINRHARQGEQHREEAVAELRSRGLHVLEASLDRAGGSSEVVRHYREQADMVVIGGGDGSLNSAAEGLVEAQLPLGILPLGTANDLARTLGIPLDSPQACQVIADGYTRRIDLGWVNGNHFFNVASIGLTARITAQLSTEAKSRWGILAYLLIAMKVLWKARPFVAEIRCDGQLIAARTVQVAVGNGRYYGGGMTVAEDAAIDDGLLHLYSLELERWWQIIPLLPALRQGRLEHWPRALTLRGRELEVRLLRPRDVSADGEIITRTPATFRVVRQALPVFVPRSASGNS